MPSHSWAPSGARANLLMSLSVIVFSLLGQRSGALTYPRWQRSNPKRRYARSVCCYTPLGEGRGDPSRFRLAPRRVSLLAASRAVRNPLPPSCVLEGTHVILTRSNPDQISFMRRFGTSDE